jgi:aryl-alcohol dehydrogenase-like predicted oxidoreductase
MNYRNLGRSGLKVSEISLGSWTTYGGSVAADDTTRIVRKAFDAGVNLFDTADVYIKGEAEKALAVAIRELPREQLVIATKCMGRVWDGPLGAGLSRKHIMDALDQSLVRLRTDYIDLYQLHAPDKDAPLEETLRTFEDLVRSGKVRYVGYSNYDRSAPLDRQVLELQQKRGWDVMVSSQPRWNLVDRHVEQGHAALCRKWGVGMIVYSPLAQGVLSNKYAGGARPEGSRATSKFAHFLEAEKALTPENVAAAERFAAWAQQHGGGTPAQLALAWVLKHDVVSSAIIGATRVEQLEENLKAGELKLSNADWKAAEAAIKGPARAAKKPAKAPKKKASVKPARRRTR